MANLKHERSQPIQGRQGNSLHSVEHRESELDLPGVTIDESGLWVARIISDQRNHALRLPTILPAADIDPQDPALNCQDSQTHWHTVADGEFNRSRTRLPFPLLELRTQTREPASQIKNTIRAETNPDQLSEADRTVSIFHRNANAFKLFLLVAVGLTVGTLLIVILTSERRQPDVAGMSFEIPATPGVELADLGTTEFVELPIPATTEQTREVIAPHDTDEADIPSDGFADVAPSVEIEEPLLKYRHPVEVVGNSLNVPDNSGPKIGVEDSAITSSKPKLRIQDLSERQLKSQLYNTVSTVDLFRNVNEFNSARAFLREPPLPPGANKLKQKITEARERRARLDASRGRSAQKNRDRLDENLTSLVEQFEQLLSQPFNPLEDILARRKDLQGLPLVMGEACHLEEPDAVTMDQVSKTVGRIKAQFDNSRSSQINPLSIIGWATSFGRPVSQGSQKHKTLANQLESCDKLGNPTQVLATLDQILQIEDESSRLALVPRARKLSSDAGMELLVRKALFDFSPNVRAAAHDALTDYPIERVRGQLLNGFEYPWHVVAQHAAESIVWLDDQAAIPELIEKLKRPDPRLPVEQEGGKYTQRQLVSISHLKNCLLCHAPSTGEQDYGRGMSPAWDIETAPTYQSASPTGAFVRADVTYLRQDFSVIQPVENSGNWPANQRFDYVVQDRRLTSREAKNSAKFLKDEPNRNREAVVITLKTLTGENPPDDEYETWLAVVADKTKSDRSSLKIDAR